MSVQNQHVILRRDIARYAIVPDPARGEPTRHEWITCTCGLVLDGDDDVAQAEWNDHREAHNEHR